MYVCNKNKVGSVKAMLPIKCNVIKCQVQNELDNKFYKMFNLKKNNII